MSGVDRNPDVSVEIGDGVVVIRRKGITRPVVANVLQFERDSKGDLGRLVLDRIVHRPYETDFGEWGVSGAFVSVLTLRTKPI
jgi:hypothetical protein